MSVETLWKASDVAKYIGSSLSWVYKKAESGELPCIRIGAMLRFTPDAIRGWASRQGTRRRRPPDEAAARDQRLALMVEQDAEFALNESVDSEFEMRLKIEALKRRTYPR